MQSNIKPRPTNECLNLVIDYEKIKKNFCVPYSDKQNAYVLNSASNTPPAVTKTLQNTYFLQHSTDTTAIGSFAGATIFGIVLALCATWLAFKLAVWYGQKSFKLTQISFEVVAEQIKASILANKENMTAQENLNKENITAQKNLKLNEIKSASRQAWINKVRDFAIDFIFISENFIRNAHLFYVATNNTDAFETAHGLEQLQNFKDILNDLRKLIISLDMHLNPDGVFDKEIIKASRDVVRHLNSMIEDIEYNRVVIKSESEAKSSLDGFTTDVQSMLKNEWNRVKKGD